jgi:hypothetical protein
VHACEIGGTQAASAGNESGRRSRRDPRGCVHSRETEQHGPPREAGVGVRAGAWAGTTGSSSGASSSVFTNTT